MSIVVKPFIAATWIPDGQIVVKPAIFATVVPSNIESVFGDTLRKVKRAENVNGDTLRRIKILPTTINGDTVRKISALETVSGDTLRRISRQGQEVVTIRADTLRKISKIETVNGDTMRIIGQEAPESRYDVSRTVEFEFDDVRFETFYEVETDCTVAQIELLGNVCASIVGGNLTTIRVRDSRNIKVSNSDS